MVTAWCEYTHQVSLGSLQQTDDHLALLDPVESSHTADNGYHTVMKFPQLVTIIQ